LAANLGTLKDKQTIVYNSTLYTQMFQPTQKSFYRSSACFRYCIFNASEDIYKQLFNFSD